MIMTRINPKSAAAVEAAAADGVKTVKRFQTRQRLRRAKTLVIRRMRTPLSLSVAAVKRLLKNQRKRRLRRRRRPQLTMTRKTRNPSVKEQRERPLPVRQPLKMKLKKTQSLRNAHAAKHPLRKALRLLK